jgi:hypothetical protein
MKNLLKGLCLLTLATSVSFAGDDKDLKKVIEDQGIYVESATKGVKLSGYVDASYTYQFAGAASTNQSALRAFDKAQNNDFNINAVKVAIEKPLSDKNEFTAGFRTDVIYGEDASLYSDGSLFSGIKNANNVALQQGYVQFRAPVGNGIDFKFGKFATPVGFEVFERPVNLNFSHGLLFQNFQPLNHTGLLASYKFNDIVDAQFGVVDGWNNVDSPSTVAGQGNLFGKSFIGRVNVTAPGGNANLAQTIVYSTDGESSIGATDSNLLYDVVGTWTPKAFNGKLLFGLNLDYLANQNTDRSNTDDSYGVALYSKYQLTKIFSLAGRGEYAHGGAINATTAGRLPDAADAYSFTLTAGFDLWQNLITRVEYRLDKSTSDIVTNKEQHQIALNMIYSF